MVGAIIDGFPVEGRAYVGGPFDWFTPFALFCGLGLVVTYALLGCTWLVMKTAGSLQARMHRLTTPLLASLLLILLAVSVWTPIAHPEIATRWFSLPNLFWLLPVPLLVLLSAWGIWHGVRHDAHYSPFLLTLLLVFLGLSGLGISIWPLLDPTDHHPVASRCAATKSGLVWLVGALFIIRLFWSTPSGATTCSAARVSHEDGYH
ncbi:cytochrome d ubiquinol oxidase, subunit II [Serratia fonticola]|uniref:Cytochrome d ubiquinol oxidase, subunit II n=1 Tax=Serratia fonticola TaxID=47917 RepID=A0A4U9U2Y6_SERFO|nr:cytochrome d ubiquinol oxidase, subunit II [Serratia fonticola]